MQTPQTTYGRNHDFHTNVSYARIAHWYLPNMLHSNDTMGIPYAIRGVESETCGENYDSSITYKR